MRDFLWPPSYPTDSNTELLAWKKKWRRGLSSLTSTVNISKTKNVHGQSVKWATVLYLIFYWVEQFCQLLKPKGHRLTWIGRNLGGGKQITHDDKDFFCVCWYLSKGSMVLPTCFGHWQIPGESCWSNALWKTSRAGRMWEISLPHRKDQSMVKSALYIIVCIIYSVDW